MEERGKNRVESRGEQGWNRQEQDGPGKNTRQGQRRTGADMEAQRSSRAEAGKKQNPKEAGQQNKEVTGKNKEETGRTGQEPARTGKKPAGMRQGQGRTDPSTGNDQKGQEAT